MRYIAPLMVAGALLLDPVLSAQSPGKPGVTDPIKSPRQIPGNPNPGPIPRTTPQAQAPAKAKSDKAKSKKKSQKGDGKAEKKVNQSTQ